MSAKTAGKPKDAQGAGNMDLGSIGDLSSLMSIGPATAASVGPIEFEMDLIDEDPNQPRGADNPGFSAASIAEIGATIRDRGVKSPISVRDNPEAPGRFLINHGARRFRGSKWAKKTTIPGFIDNDYNDADQVIENLQRNELTSREVADYIGRELAKGLKQKVIAAAIGKSESYVSQHVTLLKLPDAIAEAFSSGKVTDVTVINELVTVYKTKPEEVADWLEDNEDITRNSVKLLREFLDEKKMQEGGEGGSDGDDQGDGQGGGKGSEDDDSDEKKKTPKDPDPSKFSKAIIQVEHDGRLARLMLSKRPSEAGKAWMKYEDDGEEFETVLCDVRVLQLIEG